MSSIHFPFEILYNILGRLPVKEIIRFRCVCKAWRDLVVDPNFISTHLNLQTEDSDRCLLQYKAGRHGGGKDFFVAFNARNFAEHSNLEVPFSCETNYFKMVGSVNGLLCLSLSFSLFGRTLYLWNPSIWKLKILRGSCFRRQIEKWQTDFAIGFGFHHRTNDYKIVRIMYFTEIGEPYVEREPPRVEVFSLARNSWRKVGTNSGSYARDKTSTVVVNGCVHWFAYRTKDASGKFILAFDFDSEEFGEITLPKYHHNGDSQFHGHRPEAFLAVLRESLALIASFYKNRLICYNIWVMREYGMAESWSKQYSVVPKDRIFRCLGIVNNRDLMLDAGDEKGVISYELDKQEYNKPLVFDEDLDGLITFHESLVLYEEGFRLTPRKDLLVKGGIHLGKRKRSVFELLQQKWL
ncbi:hypothetical protein Dsin_027064 [Dipteronia sinensis]|uniref:F-box domain-containing protein n=1 Tax=Dipteronia sinensis TaxID=43782 RepID=A0AAE0DZU5_9ROSI|nr:hypothetical protein Dsin_027064 [Dipteronia sinensis]